MIQSKRILLIEPCYTDFGGYIRAIGLARAFAKKGYKVDLLVSSPKKFDLKITKTKISENITRYELPRIEVNHFITARLLRGIIGCFFVLFRTYDFIYTFALIQFESNIPFLVSRLLNKRVVADWDDYWTDAHKHVPVYNNPLVRGYLRFCEYSLQRLAKNATATSDFLLGEYKKIGVKNAIKVINGVYEEQFTPMERDEARRRLGISPEEKMILTFGNTFFKERTTYLFRVFEKINKKDDSIFLYFNNDPRKMIREQASEEKFDEKIFERIKNIGYLDKDKLALYLGAADCVLFTMGNSTLEKACFPTRIGTYINGGVPIMTNSTDTEACNTLRQYGCAVIGSDLDDLSEKIIKFLKDPIEQKSMRERVKRAKKELTWDAQVSASISFYERLK
jgi:glycosyltransferase involved in cell wall biosynthesis